MKNTEHWDLFSISTMRTFLSVSSPQEEYSIGGEPNDHKNHICSPFKLFWSSFGWQSWHLQYFFHLRCCLYHSSHILTEAGLVLKVFSSFLMCFGLLLFLWFYPPIQSFLLLNPGAVFFSIYLLRLQGVCVFFLDKLPERGKSFYVCFLKIEVVLTTILMDCRLGSIMIIMLVKNHGWYNVRIVNHVFVNWLYGGVSKNRGQISGDMALMYDLHIAASAPCTLWCEFLDYSECTAAVGLCCIFLSFNRTRRHLELWSDVCGG